MFINRYTKIVFGISLTLAGWRLIAGGTHSKSATASSAPHSAVVTPVVAAAVTPERQLIDACKKRNVKAVQAIIAHNPAIVIDACDEDGNTALMHAAHWGCKAIVDILIKLGADVNKRNQQRDTVLTNAVCIRFHDTLACLDCLIRHKADINAQDFYGFTALMRAAKFGYLDVVTCLVVHGADINARNKFTGKTALDIAQESPHDDIVAYLSDVIEKRFALYALLACDDLVHPTHDTPAQFPPEHVGGMLKPILTATLLGQ